MVTSVRLFKVILQATVLCLLINHSFSDYYSQDLQSLHEPLYKQELMATAEPSDVVLSAPPNGLPTGKLLLIIMDKNSYDNNW